MPDRPKDEEAADRTERAGDGEPTVSLNDADKTARLDDSEPTVSFDDADRTARLDDADKMARLDDGEPTVSLDDADKTARVDEADKTARPDDADKTARLDEADKTARLDDGEPTVSLDDADKTARPDDAEPTVLLSGAGQPAAGSGTDSRDGAARDGAAGDGEQTVLIGGVARPGDADGADRTVQFGAASPAGSTDRTPDDEGAEPTVSVTSAAATPAHEDGERTVLLGDAGQAGKTGGERTILLGPAGGTAADGGADRPKTLGRALRERLRQLGGQGRERFKDAPAAQAAAEKIDQLRDTRGGRLAANRAERLKQWGDEHPVARRRLLIGVPSAAGLALLVGAAEAATGKSSPPPAPRAARSPAVVRPRPAHPTEKATVHTLPVQHKPIFTLKDYRRMTGAPPFPADAIALTIDDGPHPIWTPKILRLLDRYHVPALFCMIGNQVLGHEQVARTVTNAGHQLANHTWSHPTKLAGRSRDLVRREIAHAQAKISDTTGYAPKLFRSPGGDWSPTVLQEVAHAGLIPLDWSDDPRDWSRPGVAHIKSKLLAAHPGQILLCHDGGGDRSQTYAALSTVIPALTARGLRFVAL